MYFQPLLLVLKDLYEEKLRENRLHFDYEENDGIIEHPWNSDIWKWAEKRWSSFRAAGARILGVNLFQDDSLHFATKNRSIKNLSVSLGNDVSC